MELNVCCCLSPVLFHRSEKNMERTQKTHSIEWKPFIILFNAHTHTHTYTRTFISSTSSVLIYFNTIFILKFRNPFEGRIKLFIKQMHILSHSFLTVKYKVQNRMKAHTQRERERALLKSITHITKRNSQHIHQKGVEV